MKGIPISGGKEQLGNVGSIVIAVIAIAVSAYLILRSAKRKAAVGRL